MNARRLTLTLCLALSWPQGAHSFCGLYVASGNAKLWNQASQVVMVRGVARQWVVVGAYGPPPGFESVTHLTLGVVLKLGGPIGVAAEVVAAYRAPKFLDDTYNRSVRDSVVRVSLCWLSDESFGVLAPVPAY